MWAATTFPFRSFSYGRIVTREVENVCVCVCVRQKCWYTSREREKKEVLQKRFYWLVEHTKIDKCAIEVKRYGSNSVFRGRLSNVPLERRQKRKPF